MKILYVILHGSMNPERYYNVVNTWGKNVDYLFYSDHEDSDKKIIKVSNRTDYHSNEDKHINMIHYLIKNIKNYEWFFFCDDDTFVNTKKLEQFIDKLDIESVHGSVLDGTWPGDKTLKYCSGGAGYLISYKLLSKIINNVKILNTGYSDVSIGLILRDLKIKSFNYPFFNSQPPQHYKIPIENVKDYITFHYMKSFDEMNMLFNKL